LLLKIPLLAFSIHEKLFFINIFKAYCSRVPGSPIHT
jgi:hypothetical protein